MDAHVLIINETDFPFVDTAKFEIREIVESLPPMESVRSCSVEELKSRLDRQSADVLINPYGSAFPEEAWPEIYSFLSEGGHLLNLGGCPFSVPVTNEGGVWKAQPACSDYQRQLGISAVTPVELSDIRAFSTLPEEPLLSGLTESFRCDRAYELQFDQTYGKPLPDGSPRRGAVLRPLFYAVNSLQVGSGRVAAPVIAIDHLHGPFAGGRWTLVNMLTPQPLRREMLNRLAGFTVLGPWDFQVRPSFASYYPDERATLVVHANRFEKPGPEPRTVNLFITLKKDKITVSTESYDIRDFRSPYYGEVELTKPMSPGLYTLEARLSTGDRDLTDKFSPHCVSGFWCYDEALVSMTQPLPAGKNSFVRGERPSLVIGAAYTAPDVQEKLFCDPNPALWQRDFVELRAAHANIIHTGIWTDARRAMYQRGAPSEEVMRAAIAFMLTAADHDMPVIWSLFSFRPEAWEGENPFTDPYSLACQREYVAAFTRRLGAFDNIIWDPLNEPVGDVDSATLRRWFMDVVQAIRQNGNRKQLITLGQGDLCSEVYAESHTCSDLVDFTSAHASWKNKDLLTTALLSAWPGKPSVILETGIADCGLQTADCSATENDSLALLERKLVTAYSAGASGAVEWMWSTGLCREEGIGVGLHRCDRSAKPELGIIPQIREFLREARFAYLERETEPVCMVVPTSGMKSDRGEIMHAVRTSVRAMHYGCGVPMRVVWEDALDSLGSPRLIILPSAGRFGAEAWKKLTDAAKQGAYLMVTGPIDLDEEGRPVDRLSEFGLEVETQPILPTERIIIFGSEHELRFGDRAGHLQKAFVGGNTGQLKSLECGDGRFIYAAAPFEMAENIEPSVALYKYALKQAAVNLPFNPEAIDLGILIRPQVFKAAVLYSVVSELDEDKEFDLTDDLTGKTVTIRLPARRSLMFLISREDRRIIAHYGDGVVD